MMKLRFAVNTRATTVRSATLLALVFPGNIRLYPVADRMQIADIAGNRKLPWGGFGSVVTSSSGLSLPFLMFGIAYTLFGIH